MQDKLCVWFDETLVGVISRKGNARMTFRYAPEWLSRPGTFPISHSMPLQKEPYPHEPTRAFFDNLLPEQQARRLTEKALHVSSRNIYGLLHELGAECAGALAILPEGTTPHFVAQSQRYQKIAPDELDQLIAALPGRPLLAGVDGIRLSLAGAQAKLPLVLQGNDVYLPLEGAPSTHILKPPIPDLPETVENEAFCMILARAAGLPAPAVQLVGKLPRAYLVVRYDRTVRDGRILRLHQEDFCQTLGVSPERKYENEGGPNLAACFAVLDRCKAPAADKVQLLRWVVFMFLIGNADAHAKNISLLYDEPPTPRLAPFYDVLCTAVYPGLATRLSMRIGGKYDPDYIMRRHWERLAEPACIAPADVIATVLHMAKFLLNNATKVAGVFCEQYGASPLVCRIVRFIEDRCQTTLGRIEDAQNEQDEPGKPDGSDKPE